MEYRIHVNDPWYSFLKNGEKTAEGRLQKGIYAKLKKGDIVIFFNKKTEDEFKAEIVNVNKYETFKNMLEKEGLDNVLPGIDNVKDGVGVYRQFYDEEREQELGVVAIQIKVDNSDVYYKKYIKYKLKYMKLRGNRA